MLKTAQVCDEKKNITTKEKISTLKTSEYSDFEPFWHKKRYIIRINGFPLADKFFQADIFFLSDILRFLETGWFGLFPQK